VDDVLPVGGGAGVAGVVQGVGVAGLEGVEVVDGDAEELAEGAGMAAGAYPAVLVDDAGEVGHQQVPALADVGGDVLGGVVVHQEEVGDDHRR
jgi:hypothetical protein